MKFVNIFMCVKYSYLDTLLINQLFFKFLYTVYLQIELSNSRFEVPIQIFDNISTILYIKSKKNIFYISYICYNT